MVSYEKWAVGSLRDLTMHLSFESGESGTLDLPALPYRFLINSMTVGVTKALAGTDAGTVTVGKGATVYGTATVPLSSAQNAQVAVTSASITQTAFELTDQLRLISAKTTAGGKVFVTLQLQVLPSH